MIRGLRAAIPVDVDADARIGPHGIGNHSLGKSLTVRAEGARSHQVDRRTGAGELVLERPLGEIDASLEDQVEELLR